MSRWQRIRSLFPVADDAIFLDHAGGGPISIRVDEAVRHLVDAAAHLVELDAEDAAARERARVRERVAKLIGASAREIAFTTHAETALAAVAADVSWRPGDRLLLADGANRSAWQALRSRGVETLLISRDDAGLAAERLEEALLHPRARLLSVAAVDPRSGARAPLEEVGQVCRQRGVLLCVDASHALGALAFDVERCGIDYLVCDAQRFLMALSGCALLYRSRRVARDAAAAADRFESGPANQIGITALGAAVDLWLELDPKEIESRVLALTEHLAAGLETRRIPSPSPRGAAASGIVSFALAGESVDRTVARLRAGRLRVGSTALGVRVSPHCYNDEGELDALLESL